MTKHRDTHTRMERCVCVFAWMHKVCVAFSVCVNRVNRTPGLKIDDTAIIYPFVDVGEDCGRYAWMWMIFSLALSQLSYVDDTFGCVYITVSCIEWLIYPHARAHTHTKQKHMNVLGNVDEE